MKRLKLRLLLLFTASILTLGLSHVAAQAACTQIVAGGNVYGDYDCRLRVSCGGWCYYECTCSNLFPGHTCKEVLVEAGFEMSEDPQCLN